MCAMHLFVIFSALMRNGFISSLGFAGECLGQHSGSDQGANLGDGNGFRSYPDLQLLSCLR